MLSHWSYGVVVSISGCDPLDPGSTPGTAIFLCFPFFFSFVVKSQGEELESHTVHKKCVKSFGASAGAIQKNFGPPQKM